ncbi:hypothetical protein MMC06_004195 [Schaereria dolodes]|nr:hypothetical protein [Schaereria dolodes]
MTVDKATGAKKKHNACGSVFDYAGWKAWGEWRRIQRQDVDDLNQEGSKDCINRCDYPSQCRWIIKQTPKQARFYSDSLRSNESIPEKDSVNHLQKLTDSTGKRTNQLSSLLSPVHEYEEGLGSENPELGFPVLDFAAFKASLRHPQGHPGNNDKMSAPIMIVPEVDENFEEERTSLDNIELPLRKASGTNPASAGEPSSTRTQFLHRPENITNDEASPTSPRRNAWDWTYKGSDVALSIPGEWKFDTEVEVGEIQSEK